MISTSIDRAVAAQPLVTRAPAARRVIKWSYATRRIPGLPRNQAEFTERRVAMRADPAVGDVVVAEVLAVGQHTRIELRDRRRTTLFPGDLLGMVYGYRNTSRWHEGAVPEGIETCHVLSVGGVCGTALALVEDTLPPTLLEPCGYLADGEGVMNLRSFALRPRESASGESRTIVVAGSGLESGKTMVATALVNGLCREGYRVGACKPCGTSSAADPGLFEDAGAERVLDFTDAGYPSTSNCTREQLEGIVDAMRAEMRAAGLDCAVIEVAEGLAQRESRMVLELLRERGLLDLVVYACHDSLGVRAGVNRLRSLGAGVLAVSGRVTCSPLAAREAQAESDVPVLSIEALTAAPFVTGLVRLTPRCAG